MAASCSSSLTPKWNYDVFISFRGEDTRKTFTDHLYMALDKNGIHAFKDDEKLKRGKEISQELVKAIEESRLAIIVFSENYASSTWCLDELVKILECKETKGQMVLPVFFNVDPSEVRKQTGIFAKAFAKYEEDFEGLMKKVPTWRKALTKVANLSGLNLRNILDGHEAKFIQIIVQEIWNELNQNHAFLYVSKHQVGLDSRVEKVNLLLDVGRSDDVRFIGICGIGGIGKTTIAKAIYNEISGGFDGSSFLANVRREVSTRPDGLLNLQRQLLFEILTEAKLNISSVDRGVRVMEERLCHRKVLLILDDVNRLDQLEKLAGKPNWFGPGSRIIITTRDEHMLTAHEVHGIYMVEKLNENEALQLFSLNAFNESCPISDFLNVSSRVVSYSDGLPLALNVLGSFLFDKRNIDEWASALDKLRRIPNNDIHEMLKVSFDGLDEMEKDVFLDVACFFNGVNKEHVIRVLESCGFYPDIGLRILTQRSLITIYGNKLWIHDLLIEMGKEIVRKQSPKDPGRRSRLWSQEDVHRVLTTKTGTEAIEGIVLNFSTLEEDAVATERIFLSFSTAEEVHFSNEAFVRMHNLRLLKVFNVHPAKDFNYLPNELRCLNWVGYPLTSLPSRFHPKNLAELSMPYSRLEQLSETKILKNLEILDLSNSQYLTKPPDFSGMPRLKRLILNGCTRLVEVPPSISALNMLVFLNMKDCKSLSLWRNMKLESLENLILSGCSKLEKFPEILGTMEYLSQVYLDGTGIKELPSSIEHLTGLVLLNLENCKNLACLPGSICELKSLKTLILSGCSNLDMLPEKLENMQNLVELYLGGTAIRKPPSSIVCLKNLQTLSFRGCKGSPANSWKSFFSYLLLQRKIPRSNNLLLPSLSGLCSLKKLDLSDCNLSGGAFLSDIGNLSSLQHLDLSKNNFVSLPASLSRLNCLETLMLEHCTQLQSLPPLPTSICEIVANGCSSLEELSHPPQNLELDYRQFAFGSCKKLTSNQGNMRFQRLWQASFEFDMASDLFLTGSEIPNWFNHQSNGPSISFKMPPLDYSKFKGVAMCAVYTLKGASHGTVSFMCKWTDAISGTDLRQFTYHATPGDRYTELDHVWLTYEPCCYLKGKTGSDGWCHILASFTMEREDAIKCGVHIVYEEDEAGIMQYSSSQNLEIIHDDFDKTTVEEEEDIKRKRSLDDCDFDEEEPSASGSSNSPKRLRLHTDALLKLKGKEESS